MKSNYLTMCEVDGKALEHNLLQLKKLAARNEFCLPTRSKKQKGSAANVLAVVKADAYGHGMKNVALMLDRSGVKFFAVSDISEGIALRKIGIDKPILLFESTLESQAKKIVHYRLMPTVCTLELARQLDKYAQKVNRRIDIHVKVDTGMGRLGVWHEEAFDFISEIFTLRHLRIMGIFTHFPAADTDRKFTQRQLKDLYHLVVRLDQKGMVIPYVHAANSMGLAGYKTRILNLTRPGLMLYGLYPHPRLKKHISLKPVMSVTSQVIFLKSVKKGRSISYGRTFLTKKEMTVATIPIGYNDGYFRSNSNKSCVLIGGLRCPVLGRVTMDQIIVDASRVQDPKIGMPVTILGKQGDEEITADELAGYSGTINYEIVCSLGNRLPRIVK